MKPVKPKLLILVISFGSIVALIASLVAVVASYGAFDGAEGNRLTLRRHEGLLLECTQRIEKLEARAREIASKP